MNRRRRPALWLLCLGAFFLLCTAANADEAAESDYSMEVIAVRLLTLDRESLQFFPKAREMIDGFTHQQVLHVEVSANVGWVLTVSGTAGNWRGPWDKPVEDVYWKYGEGGYTALSTSPAEVSSAGPANQRTLPIHIKIKLDIEEDVPGQYFYEYVIFELVEP